jgi:hypothetical protein
MPNKEFQCVIDNCIVGTWPMDGDNLNSEEAVLCLDRIAANKCRVLSHRYTLVTDKDWFMFVLPYVAKWFGVDRNELLRDHVKSNFC